VLFVMVRAVGRASRRRAATTEHNGADRRASTWSGPGGVSIRPAQAHENTLVSGLASASGGELAESLKASIAAGTVARTLRASRPGSREGLKLFTRALSSNDLNALHELSLVLVAERGGVVIGEVSVSPAIGLARSLLNDGVPPAAACAAATKLAKVTSLAVAADEDFSALGATLMRAAAEVYDEAGYVFLYSSVPAHSEALSRFTDHGFELVPLKHQVSLWSVFAEHIFLKARDGEQLLVRAHNPESGLGNSESFEDVAEASGIPRSLVEVLARAT
jgi:predicted N-acetyltransferase YhbS